MTRTLKACQTAVNRRNAALENLRKHLGRSISGRKPKQIPVTVICDALAHSSSMEQAAAILGVSRAYIYKYVSKPMRLLGLGL